MFSKAQPKPAPTMPAAISGTVLALIPILKKFGLTNERVSDVVSKLEDATRDVVPIVAALGDFIITSDARLRRIEDALERIEMGQRRLEQGKDFVGDPVDVSQMKLLPEGEQHMPFPLPSVDQFLHERKKRLNAIEAG